ncbi:MAG: Lipoprotein releasing system transrane protein LolC, partial [Labilithrix sp.]|nr:Lipoprotein releasing system transrane protein LolC [Labilithrix sp.]
MGYPIQIALRYLGSKKRAFVSVGTAFAMLGVALGVAALAIVMSVTGGFQEQFREKVLGVNAHVIVLKYAVHFRDYRDVMKKVEAVPGVVAVAPFVINPMMVTHGERTATGVLLKGVDPELMPKVLDLPRHIVEGSLDGMRKAGAKPPEAPRDSFSIGSAPPKTGALETNDAGTGAMSVLEAIEKQIAEDKAKDQLADAGTTDLATLIATGAAGEIDARQDKKKPAAQPEDPLDAILGGAPPTSTSASADEPAPAPAPPPHPAGDVTPAG